MNRGKVLALSEEGYSQKEIAETNANRFKKPPEIKAEMRIEHGVHMSPSTTVRRLREAELNGCKSRQNPLLTARHKKARLAYARLHKNWTIRHWSRVLFSDESRFLNHRSDGCVCVRRMVREALNENCVQSSVKGGGGEIMVCSCIGRKGSGIL